MKIGAKKKYAWPLNDCDVRPPTTIVDDRHQQTEHERAGVTHEDARGMEVVRQEPDAQARHDDRDERRPGCRAGSRRGRRAAARRGRTSPRRSPMMPAASPSRPSMRLMAFIIPTTHSTVTSAERSLDRNDSPKNGTRNTTMLDTGERQHAAGEHHAGGLRRRRDVAEVVDRTDRRRSRARRARCRWPRSARRRSARTRR